MNNPAIFTEVSKPLSPWVPAFLSKSHTDIPSERWASPGGTHTKYGPAPAPQILFYSNLQLLIFVTKESLTFFPIDIDF